MCTATKEYTPPALKAALMNSFRRSDMVRSFVLQQVERISRANLDARVTDDLETEVERLRKMLPETRFQNVEHVCRQHGIKFSR